MFFEQICNVLKILLVMSSGFSLAPSREQIRFNMVRNPISETIQFMHQRIIGENIKFDVPACENVDRLNDC